MRRAVQNFMPILRQQEKQQHLPGEPPMSNPEMDERMDDAGSAEYWRDVRGYGKAKRASNRESSANLLREAGIEFTAMNNGAHLFVRGRSGEADFWPGTGLWTMRETGRRGRGVWRLMKIMGGD